MTEYIVALTTLADEDAGAELARSLIERRLVACVNIVPGARSLYRWKGEIEDEPEVLLFMKTRADRFEALAAAIDEIHPYEEPELIALGIETGSAGYLRFIDENVSA